MIFLDYLFRAILVIDVFLAIASFAFAYILLFRRDRKNPIYFNFGMAVLSLALWLSSILLLFVDTLPISGVTLENLTYLFGIGILHYFLIFSLTFPTPARKRFLKVFILYIFTALVSTSFFIPGLYALTVVRKVPFLYAEINPIGVSIFSIYFAILSILSFINLVSNFKKSDGIFRLHLKRIIIGTLIAIIVNSIFSVLNAYVSSFDLSSVGAISIFVVLFYIYSILFSK